VAVRELGQTTQQTELAETVAVATVVYLELQTQAVVVVVGHESTVDQALVVAVLSYFATQQVIQLQLVQV
jgi:hypothetical protein